MVEVNVAFTVAVGVEVEVGGAGVEDRVGPAGGETVVGGIGVMSWLLNGKYGHIARPATRKTITNRPAPIDTGRNLAYGLP